MPDLVVGDVRVLSQSVQVQNVASGEALARGDVLYSLNNKSMKASAIDEPKSRCDGLAITSTDAADAAVLVVRNGADIDLGVDLNVGTTYAVSDTPGKIRPLGEIAVGQFPTILGTATEVRRLPLKIQASGVAKT